MDVLRDARTFTVDDPRFSTAKVVGPSMLSLDGAQHTRHRAPFTRPFRSDEIHAQLTSFTRAEACRLVTAIRPRGAAELRRAVAGPLAAAVMAEALGLGETDRTDPAKILGWYDGIVAAVQAEAAMAADVPPGRPAPGSAPGQAVQRATVGQLAIAGSEAFAELAASLRQVIAADRTSLLAAVTGPLTEARLTEARLTEARLTEAPLTEAPLTEAPLTEAEAISNAAVLLFGGIETTEGMIANAVLHLLSSPPGSSR